MNAFSATPCSHRSAATQSTVNGKPTSLSRTNSFQLNVPLTADLMAETMSRLPWSARQLPTQVDAYISSQTPVHICTNPPIHTASGLQFHDDWGSSSAILLTKLDTKFSLRRTSGNRALVVFLVFLGYFLFREHIELDVRLPSSSEFSQSINQFIFVRTAGVELSERSNLNGRPLCNNAFLYAAREGACIKNSYTR